MHSCIRKKSQFWKRAVKHVKRAESLYGTQTDLSYALTKVCLALGMGVFLLSLSVICILRLANSRGRGRETWRVDATACACSVYSKHWKLISYTNHNIQYLWGSFALQKQYLLLKCQECPLHHPMWIDLKDSRTFCTSVVCCIKHTPTPISDESSRSIVSEWLLSCCPKHNCECSAPAECPAGAVNQTWPPDWHPGCSRMEHRRMKGSFSRDNLPKGITSIAGKQGQALMMLSINARELWGHC